MCYILLYQNALRRLFLFFVNTWIVCLVAPPVWVEVDNGRVVRNCRPGYPGSVACRQYRPIWRQARLDQESRKSRRDLWRMKPSKSYQQNRKGLKWQKRTIIIPLGSGLAYQLGVEEEFAVRAYMVHCSYAYLTESVLQKYVDNEQTWATVSISKYALTVRWTYCSN